LPKQDDQKRTINNIHKRKALIVAVSNYTDLQRLNFCKNDGKELHNILSSLGYGISEGDNLIGEVKGEKIREKIFDFFHHDAITPDDTLLFYY
jgi:hypothetical protein